MTDHNRIEELERALQMQYAICDKLTSELYDIRVQRSNLQKVYSQIDTGRRLEWLRIENAPRDGTLIILRYKGDNVAAGYWYYDICSDSGIWCCVLGDYSRLNLRPDDVTHWLPIISDLGVMP